MRRYRNEWDRLREQAVFFKENYPPGTRIKLISMGEDKHRIPDNMRGTVTAVDDAATLHCHFDNGRSLGIIPGENRFRKLTEAELKEEQGDGFDVEFGMTMGR